MNVVHVYGWGMGATLALIKHLFWATQHFNFSATYDWKTKKTSKNHCQLNFLASANIDNVFFSLKYFKFFIYLLVYITLLQELTERSLLEIVGQLWIGHCLTLAYTKYFLTLSYFLYYQMMCKCILCICVCRLSCLKLALHGQSSFLNWIDDYFHKFLPNTGNTLSLL